TACIVVSILLFRQNQSLKNQVTDRHADLQALSEIIEKAGSGSLVTFMQHILEELNTAMQSPAYAGINDTLIAKLSALSNSFTPYPYFEADSISARKISPERGQLLIALLLLDIDSVSLQKIKSAVSFSGANLNGANLAGVDLSGADLRGAHFKEANLKGANLNGADMSDALLLAANLDSATLISTNLKRADMRWSRHNFAQMQAANLNGALMTNAQFIHTDLYKASLQFADVSGAIFYKGNLHSADLMGTTMVKTNFTEADMDYTNLRLTNPQESIWDNTSLHKATVDSMWMQKMEQWRLIGKEAILQHYQLANDTADQWNNPLHRLNKKSRN
ncbi:MAG: pentapeptide repeat-containing protein, partial [Chitinophagales bacterium]